MSDEIKKEDSQNVQVEQEKKIEETKEDSPIIKTEENQANWKKFREEREKEKQERIKAQELAERKQAEAEALKAAMEAILNKPQAQNNNQPAYELDETEEERIERKVQAALKREKDFYDQQRKAEEQKNLPAQLNRTHSDFNDICSEENVDYLQFHYPEIALGFRHMPDNFEKWNALYKTIKKLIPNVNRREDEKRIEKNMLKPQATTPSMSDTNPQASSSNWKEIEAQRKANWERMRKDARGI